MPGDAVCSKQGACQATQRGAGFHGGGVFLRQAQVFEHQISAKAAHVALAGRGVFMHAGEGVVFFQSPVAARAAAHDFGKHLGIQAVGHAQGDGFGGTGHQNAQQHVVADFGGLACAHIARVEDVGTHFFQQRAGAFQQFCAAAHHEGEGARNGAAGAAGHWGVDKVNARSLRGLGHFLAGGGGNGGAVDDQGTLGNLAQQTGLAVTAQEQAFHVLAGGQHGDDGLGTLHSVLRAGCGLATFGHHFGHGVLAQVKGLDAVARFDEVDGHGAAHVAQADECDLHGESLLWE